jgi:hypothetical protein
VLDAGAVRDVALHELPLRTDALDGVLPHPRMTT